MKRLALGLAALVLAAAPSFSAAAPPQPAYVTGSPTTGAIAKASGPQSLTTGDLTGDVTTSGSTATTLATSGVTAGSYTCTNATFDAKGRATAASNGSCGGGGSATVVAPQGRLTLTSNTPVMTADATAQTTIYYTPYVGNQLPIGGAMLGFSQTSYALNTTAHASGNLYDLFGYSNSGTLALCTGPAWTNSTTRLAAISLSAGIWVNTASLTCTLTGSTSTTSIGAGSATYLGTFYATANGQTGMAFMPAAAAGGTNNILGLYNAYNRVPGKAVSRDNTASWTYATTTWRAMNASNSNRISFVDGLQQSAITGLRQAVVGMSGGGLGVYTAMNLDSTSATPNNNSNAVSTAADYFQTSIEESWTPQLGFHYVQAMEYSTGSTGTFYGAFTSPTRQGNQMYVSLLM